MPQDQKTLDRRKKYQLGDFEKSQTQQHHVDACDINKIMAKFRKTGLIDHVQQHQGVYKDVASVGDFTDAMNIVAKASQSFEQLPSEMRLRFNNDPAEFLDFVKNPKNSDQLIEMGLAVRREVPQKPSPVEVKIIAEGDDPKPPKGG